MLDLKTHLNIHQDNWQPIEHQKLCFKSAFMLNFAQLQETPKCFLLLFITTKTPDKTTAISNNTETENSGTALALENSTTKSPKAACHTPNT
jgi:hypothetical protein